MYAAAGGASLASRQARKRQQQQNNKQKLLQQKLAAARSGVVTPTRVQQQSRQFHQLPSSYLRTPQAQARKLSASYTRQSQLLLPIVEGNQQQQQQQQQQHQHPSHFHPAHHHHHHIHPQDYDGSLQLQRPLTPKPGGTPLHHRQHTLPHHLHHHHHHHHHLTKSATASFPLVSQVEATPPTTPVSSLIGKHPPSVGDALHPQSHFQLPCPQDSIIITPATPIASPGHKPSTTASRLTGNEGILITADGTTIPTTTAAAADASTTITTTGQLERKCSFYRVRRSDAFEHDDNYSVTGGIGGGVTITTAQQLDPYTDENLLYSGLPNGVSGHKWAETAYCEQGICTCCEQIEDRQMTLSLSINGVQQYLFLTENGFKCAQGRAAWLERGRRCSVQDNNPAYCHRRWKRNRIHDSSLGGSSDDEDLLGVLRGPSSFANAFLYVGLGTIAIGLVIAFVGTGEKGFKTVELRLIGPSLIGIGLICCILRICFCICPSHCISSSRRTRKKNNTNKIDADHTTSLLRGESKRVSIAKGPHLQKFPLTHKKSNNKMLNEGMEALRQIATTSLFLQNEQKPSTNRVVPIIKEPEKPPEEAPLEMKKLDMALNITDISDDEDEDDEAASAPSFSNNNNYNFNNNNNNNNINNNNNNNNNDNNNQEKQKQQRQQKQKNISLDQSQNGKLSRRRTSTNQQKHELQQHHQQQNSNQQKLDKNTNINNDETILMETSLIIVNNNQLATTSNSNLILSPHQQSSIPLPPSSSSSILSSSIPYKTTSLSVPACYDLPPSIPHQYSNSTATSNNSTTTTSTTTTTTTYSIGTSNGVITTITNSCTPLTGTSSTISTATNTATLSAINNNNNNNNNKSKSNSNNSNNKSITFVDQQKQHTPGQILEIDQDTNHERKQSELAQKSSSQTLLLAQAETQTVTSPTAALSLQLPSSSIFTSTSSSSSSSSAIPSTSILSSLSSTNTDDKNKIQTHHHHHQNHQHQRRPSISITTPSNSLASNSKNTIPITITTTRQQQQQQQQQPLLTLPTITTTATTPTINSESEIVLSPAKLGQ